LFSNSFFPRLIFGWGFLVLFRRLYFVVFLILFCVSCTERSSLPKVSPESAKEFSQENAVDNRTQVDVTQTFEVVAPPNQQQRATGVLTPVDLGQVSVIHSVGNVDITNNAPANGFPLGATVVVWSAVDAMGNAADAIQIVNVDVGVACSTSELFFQQRVWPVINQYCMECHTANKVSSGLNFVDAIVPGYLEQNFLHMKNSSVLLDNNNESVFLNKVTNKNSDHGGEFILSADSADYQTLSSMIERFGVCEKISISPLELILLSPSQQLRKTTLALAGRLPTTNELAIVNGAISSIEVKEQMGFIIDKLLMEKSFYQRLKEIYNDLLLTDAFKNDAKALGLSLNDFDNRNYFGTTELMQLGYNGTDSNLLREYANYGLSQAPLELISYVVKNDIPFTEILTADYVMVNPYSATIFNANVVGENDFNFTYGADWNLFDYERFLPVKLTDNKARTIPHAGILTTLPFLSRYPSSSTNLNRKRARYVFQYFLDTDVEGLADRGGLDLGNVVGLFPTLEDPQCKICHDVLDPIAGLFKNWNVSGRYLGNNLNWLHSRQPQEMLAPGFSQLPENILPDSDSASALRWLAYRIISDNRFVSSTVKTIFKGFAGINITDDPVFYQSLKTVFINQNFNLKKLIKEIVLSPYFVARNALASSPVGQVGNVGTAHLLTPEHLDRKIKAIFNEKQWQSPSKRNLLSEDSYLLLYGGIDSIEVTQRTEQATSIIAGAQARIANQLACELVPLDFDKALSQRELFPLVNINHLPDNAINTSLIKQNIQYLFSKILGQEFSLIDPEIERAYGLFLTVLAMTNTNNIGQECSADLLQTNPVVIDELYTVRAWMAVVNYMLRDYYFLYE